MLGFDNGPKASSNPPRPKYAVTFVLPDGQEYQEDAREGDSLVLASGRSENPSRQGVWIVVAVLVKSSYLKGNDSLSPITAKKPQPKKPINIPAEHRLGCQTAVLGEGVKVKIINVLGVDGDF